MAGAAQPISHLCRNGDEGRRQSPTRKAAAERIIGAGDQDRPGACDPRRERGLRQGRQGLDPRRAREEGAGHRLDGAASTPRSSAAQQKFQAYHAGVDPASWRRWSARSRSTRGRTGWRSTRSTSRPLSCPRRSATPASPSTAPRCSGTPKQRPRDKRRSTRSATQLQDAVGKAYVDKYFPASAQGRNPGHGRRTSRPPSPSASRRSTGWRRRPRQKR